MPSFRTSALQGREHVRRTPDGQLRPLYRPDRPSPPYTMAEALTTRIDGAHRHAPVIGRSAQEKAPTLHFVPGRSFFQP